MNTSYLLNGQPTPPVRAVTLRCGPLQMHYRDGKLRSIRAGKALILNEIYAAVRDQNWDTISGALVDEQIEQGTDHFRVSFRSEHQRGEIDFAWQGLITGSADGVLTFHFRGEARSTFKRNRIGFCVLHPLNAAGQPCRIEHIDGSVTEAAFPQAISPHQPFFNIRTVLHEVIPGLWAETRMEGDTFEMEDQRQWIDASFKTYCTPLAQPFPAEVPAGTLIEQQITLRLHGDPPKAAASEADALSLTLQTDQCPLPRIGLCAAEHGEALSAQADARLRALKLDHLRVDLRMKGDWKTTLERAVAEAGLLGCPLELAVHINDDAESQLGSLRDVLQQQHSLLSRVLIFHDGERSVQGKWVTLAREILKVGVPVGGGTDAFFTELNRGRPDADAFDVISYSSNPQVHAFDDESIIETTATLPITVATAETFCAGKPIALSPLTFRMRWNPNATAPSSAPGPGELPARYDARQMSLFGAVWTLASLKSLSMSSVHSLTYYETTGWGGVMEREMASPLPDKFPSQPGQVFPMYHVFADVGDFKSGNVLAAVSSDPLKIEALALKDGIRLRLIIANLTPDTQQIALRQLPAGTLSARRLDLETVIHAMNDPEGYRTSDREQIPVVDGTAMISLTAYGLLTLDGAAV